MSALLSSAGMPGSKKDKHFANSRARRESIVISHGKKRKKDTDTESVSSSSETVVAVSVPPAPPKPQCPLRGYLPFLFEIEDDGKKEEGDKDKKAQCPVKRVHLSHSLILAFLIAINTAFVIVTLLITLLCRGAVSFGTWISNVAARDFSTLANNVPAPKAITKSATEEEFTPAEPAEPMPAKERRNSKSSIAASHLSA